MAASARQTWQGAPSQPSTPSFASPPLPSCYKKHPRQRFRFQRDARPADCRGDVFLVEAFLHERLVGLLGDHGGRHIGVAVRGFGEADA